MSKKTKKNISYQIINKVKTHNRFGSDSRALALLVAIMLLIGITYERNHVWHDELTLCKDMISKSPNKARGYNNLGNEYSKRGELNEAIQAYSIALKIKPDFVDALASIGVAYGKMGYLNEAKAVFEQVLNMRPDYKTYWALGMVYDRLGRYDEAIKAYNESLRLNPNYAAYFGIGVIFLNQGKFELAIKEFQMANELNSNSPEIFYYLGVSYQALGLEDKAQAAFYNYNKLNH